MKTYLKKMLNIIGMTVKYGCLSHCILEYIGDVALCVGPSMEPTIHNNDIVLTERVSTRLHHFDVGDIIIARNPFNPHEHICKRIVGLPGDKIYHGFKVTAVPPGHVWLEGDNISNSTDSRIYGPVPQGLIRSRVVYRIWPQNKKQNNLIR